MSVRSSSIRAPTSFFGEIGLIGDVGDERVTMGGAGASFEDCEAKNVTQTPL